jgi:hypothetical protein
MIEKISSMNEKLLNHFGIDHQLHKLEEELTELLLVTKRVRSGSVGLLAYQFIEELADVENVLSQIKMEVQREFVAAGDDSFAVETELDRIKLHKLNKIICVEGISPQ